MMAIGKEREILTIGREVFRQPGSGQRIRQRVGRETRGALLAVGDNRSAGRFHPLDRIATSQVLFMDEFFTGNFACVVGSECSL
jgi:hypothetical protein